eukprot:m.213617 g.213617  ORF g.213617 m.213617 type:complete len:204 (+) comp19061_c0_seq1:767-1378(+)
MCNFTTGAFRHVYNFARASNARLLFDLSELAGRTCNDSQNCRGPWDTANVRLLLEYVRAEGLFEPNGTLIGFELGNEVFAPPLLLPEAVVADNRLLAAMLHDLFGGTHAAVPLHYAPATNKCGGPENAPVMDNLTNVISGWSFHTYPGAVVRVVRIQHCVLAFACCCKQPASGKVCVGSSFVEEWRLYLQGYAGSNIAGHGNC